MKLNEFGLEDVINTIENNLAGEISVTDLAKKLNLSIYEFRRIFSFVTKIPINEYIRKRRLSCAAQELLLENSSITEIALRYGYDSTSSFARAFKAFHGVSPSEAKDGAPVKTMTTIGFSLMTSGGADISYRIIKDDEFDIFGFSGESDISDTECCENVWEDFYNSKIYDTVTKNSDFLYVAYQNGENNVKCYIGAKNPEAGNMTSIHIPKTVWACFKMHDSSDESVNKFYNYILFQWLKSAKYEKDSSIPNLEIYPKDMENVDFEWEIRIPLKGDV